MPAATSTAEKTPSGEAPALSRCLLRFVNPFGISYYTRQTHEVVVARWRWNGIECYGESSHYYGENPESVERAFRASHDLLALGPDGWEHHAALLEQRLPNDPSVRALIDLLWFDALGKSLNAPVWRLLGTDPKRAAMSSFTIGLASIEETLRKVDEAKTFRALKIKLGSKEPGHDLEVMRQVRRAAPNTILRVDANTAWTPEFAREAARALADLGVEFIEQPLPKGNLEAMGALRRESPLPIWADEDCRSPADVLACARAGLDGVVVKIMKNGGIAATLRTIHAARAAGLRVMLGCMVETAVGISAASHLAPLVDCCDLDGNILVANDPFDGARVAPDGTVQVPTGPGLGARPRDGAEFGWRDPKISE